MVRERVLAYSDDLNLIGFNIRTIEINADVLLNACTDFGLAVNTGKTILKNIMFLHRWEISVRINLRLFSTVVPAIIAGTTVENKRKLILRENYVH